MRGFMLAPITIGVVALGPADAAAIEHDPSETPCSVDEFAKGGIRLNPASPARGFQLCRADPGSPTSYRWWTSGP